MPAQEITAEVESRLKKLSRTVHADGFRPGKVPMSVVAQRYGTSVQYEVMNDKIGAAFEHAANEAKLRVAGMPRITPKEGAPEGRVSFDATFEVYPEVKLGDICCRPRSSGFAATSTMRRSTARSTSCASSGARLRSARPARARPKATA